MGSQACKGLAFWTLIASRSARQTICAPASHNAFVRAPWTPFPSRSALATGQVR